MSDAATAVEKNLHDLFRVFGSWPKVTLHDAPELIWTLTGIPFPLFNAVTRARLEDHNADQAIEQAKGRCAERSVPMWWWTGPSDEPADLEHRLVAHGFEARRMPGMAVDLKALPNGSPSPDGFTVTAVDDDVAARTWCRVFCHSFGLPEFVGAEYLDCMRSVGLERLRHYLGWLDGAPVAVSSVFCSDGTAGVYSVGTIESARRQGIGAAMTLRPLQEARQAGASAGVLSSSPMGLRVYAALGFVEHCTIGVYGWSCDASSAGVAPY